MVRAGRFETVAPPTPWRVPRPLVLVGLVLAAAVGGLLVGGGGTDPRGALQVEHDAAAPEAGPADDSSPDSSPPHDWGDDVQRVGEWRTMAPAPLSGRTGTVSAWTGTELIVWGGAEPGGIARRDGAAYRPDTDSWRRLAQAPIAARQDAAAAWTGRELLIWGGGTRTGPLPGGAAYDPAADAWRRIAPAPRTLSRFTWAWAPAGDGDDGAGLLLVWGSDPDGHAGLVYDVAQDAWRPMGTAPVPTADEEDVIWGGEPQLVWLGDRALLWGRPVVRRSAHDGRGLPAAATYDPVADRWTGIATPPADGAFSASLTWTGERLYALGRTRGPAGAAMLIAWDPTTDTWQERAEPPLRVAGRPDAAWTGTNLVAYEGAASALYRERGDRWRPMATPPLHTRFRPTVVWTGTALLVWGGVGSQGLPQPDGALWSPTRVLEPREPGTWRALPPAPGPGRHGHTATWTGTEVLFLGGYTNAEGPLAADAYDPAAGTWRRIPAAGVPARHRHQAVWTGTEVVLLGGHSGPSGTAPADDAWALDPATGHWRRLAPPPLWPAAAVWDGGRVLAAGPAHPDGGRLQAAAWEPSTDAWTPLEDPPTLERLAGGVWTGDRFVLQVVAVPPAPLPALDPVTGRWELLSPLPPTARVLSGLAATQGRLRAIDEAGAVFRHHRGAWAPLPGAPVASATLVVAGNLVLAVGEPGPRLAVVDADLGTVRLLLDPPLARRHGVAAAWAGDALVLWGGASMMNVPLDDGAVWSPAP
jgi:hypothetical protein